MRRDASWRAWRTDSILNFGTTNDDDLTRGGRGALTTGFDLMTRELADVYFCTSIPFLNIFLLLFLCLDAGAGLPDPCAILDKFGGEGVFGMMHIGTDSCLFDTA
jgi:hypothetical protein